MIELIMVMLVISALAVGVLNILPSPSGMQLVSARNQLMRDIRFAQNAAVTQQAAYGLKLDIAQQKYSIYQGEANYSNIIQNPVNQRPYEVDLSSAYSNYVELLSTDLAGEVVQFDLFGSPFDTGGTVNVRKNVILRDTKTGDTRQILIQPITGGVKEG